MDNLVVDKKAEEPECKKWLDPKKYSSAIVIAILLIVVACVAYYKCPEGFVNVDGAAARRSQNQVRSDAGVDHAWNLAEFERSVALINKKAST